MIVSVWERKRLQRLKEKDIVIETIYSSINNKNKFVKATDGLINETVENKKIVEKRFFYKGNYLNRIVDYRDDILYTIKEYNDETEIVKCPNCASSGEIINYIDGCPYCHTNFNFGINNINKSNKVFYGFSLIYSLILGLFLPIIFFLIVIPIAYITKNNAIVYKIIIASILIYILLIVVFSVKKIKHNRKEKDYRNKLNWRNEFGNENNFYNDIYNELLNIFFSTDYNKDIVDFDINNYNSLDFVNENEIIANIDIRVVCLINGHLDISKNNYKLTLKRNRRKILSSDGENYKIIECPTCGSSIKLDEKICPYCKKINSLCNDWIIKSVEKYN